MNKPLIIAHRGASGYAPENTLKAFRLAADLGADGIELDVFLTRDKQVVVTHDETLERLTGKAVVTRQTTLKELQELDFGQGERISTLREVLEELGPKFSMINIEIKSTGYFTDGIEREVVSLIQKLNMLDKVLLSSFNPLHLLRTRCLCPQIKIGYLVSPQHRLAQQTFWVSLCRAVTINLGNRWADDPKRFERFQKLNIPIWVWTVNDMRQVPLWLERGVAAIITNYPDKLRKVIQENTHF